MKKKSIISYGFAVSLILSDCAKKNNTDPVPSPTDNIIAPASICPAIAPIELKDAVNFGDGTPSSCTQTALQTLINNGGKIKCNCGSDPFTLKINASLTIPNKEVIIDGANLLTIDGNSSSRIFDKTAATKQESGTLFAIQNMKLINGNAAGNKDERGGAAIYGRAFGSLQVVNVMFLNNIGPSASPDDCGAVHTILYKSALFSNCTFKGNTGANGGAVGTIGSSSEFINCTFDGNKAVGAGGNSGGGQGGIGGAIYNDGVDQNGVNNSIKLCGCIFLNNQSGYEAGALSVIFYASKGSIATIDKCTFDNNSCSKDKGGAYYHMNGKLTVSNSTFSNNTSPSQGGGLWVSNTPLVIYNSTFYKNSTSEGTNGLGGAICIDGSGNDKNAEITYSTFAENKAGLFASAIMNSGNLTLRNTLFYKNEIPSNPYAGSAINKESNLTVGKGNLQYPKDFSGQFGQGTDQWITADVLTTDALLQPLAENEGNTKTMALGAGSPAIGKAVTISSITSDQRGKTRKSNPDIGAFETQ